MEKLTLKKRAEVSKMSTKRLPAKLIKAGYDEDEIVQMERGDLLNVFADYLITPWLPESPEKAGAVGGTSAAEIEFGKQELEFCKQEKQEVEDRDEKRKIWRGRDNGILLPLRIFSRSMKFRLNYSQNV